MARKAGPDRRPPRKRARPLYHEPQPGGTSRGNVVIQPHPRGEAQGLGWVAWIGIALLIAMLVDTVAWHGFYAHKVWLALRVDGSTTRGWSDNLWK